MLFGGCSGQGLEPMAVVGATVFDRLLPHRTRNGVRDHRIQ